MELSKSSLTWTLPFMFDGYVFIGLARQHLHHTFITIGFVVRTTDGFVNPRAHSLTRVNIYVETNRVKRKTAEKSHYFTKGPVEFLHHLYSPTLGIRMSSLPRCTSKINLRGHWKATHSLKESGLSRFSEHRQHLTSKLFSEIAQDPTHRLRSRTAAQEQLSLPTQTKKNIHCTKDQDQSA